jgi:hypothetical protein
MSDLLVALGLVLVIEGLIYGAFPSAARRMLEAVREVPDSTLRGAGLTALALGVLIVWLVRG